MSSETIIILSLGFVLGCVFMHYVHKAKKYFHNKSIRNASDAIDAHLAEANRLNNLLRETAKAGVKAGSAA